MSKYSKEFKEEAIRLSDEIGNKKTKTKKKNISYFLIIISFCVDFNFQRCKDKSFINTMQII